MTTSNYEQCLKDCIKHNQQIIFKLSELLVEVEHHHDVCNTVRTCGTSAGIAGAGLMIGSLLVAPFSDRLSTAVTFLAAGFSMGGAATNLILGVLDRNRSKEIIDQIQSLVQSRNHLIAKLKEQSNHFTTIIKHLTSNGLSEDQAIKIALNALVNSDVDLKQTVLSHTFRSALVTLGRVLQVQFDVLKGVSPNSNAAFVPSVALSESRDLLVNTVERFTLFSRGTDEISVLNTGEETIGFSGLMATAAVITSIVISVIDLVCLIRNWTSSHPTVKVIMDVRRQLEAETKSFEDILSSIEQVRNRPNPISINHMKKDSPIDRAHDVKVTSPNENISKDVQTSAKTDAVSLLIKQMLGRAKKPIKSMSFEEKSQHEPVINNDVLFVQRDIIDMFLHQRFSKTLDQLRKIPSSSSIYRAYYHPFATEIQYNIQTRMVARFMNDSTSPKIVDLLYNVLINLIRNTARDQMIHLYDYGTHQGSPYTSILHAADVQMSKMCVFVDDTALNHWLHVNGGDKRAYETAQLEVYRMFVNLDNQTRLWVNELKSFGY